MHGRIPYINTRIEDDILLTLLLTPLWWILGFGIFTYHLTVLLVFTKLITGSLRTEQGVRISKETIGFIFFLLSYLASIAINIPYRYEQRIFASLNNYLLLVMGFLLMLVVYNCDFQYLFRRFARTCRYLCMISIVIGMAMLGYWFRYRHHFEADSLLARHLSSLLNYPYFYVLLKMTGTMSDWFSGSEFPRLTLYSQPPTATGGLMIMIIPFMAASYVLSQKKKFPELVLVFVLSAGVLFFSFSRAAIYGFVIGWIFVRFFARNKKAIVLFGFLVLAAVMTGLLDKGVEFILNLRKASTTGRFELYEEAFRILGEENPIMGLGVRLRESFTMEAIGSHALYIEILFVAGLIGLVLFLVFQGMVMVNWYSQQKLLKNKTERSVWEFFGISLIATNIWLLSDTLLAMPYIAYLYFLITGGSLLFSKFLHFSHLDPSFLDDTESVSQDEI